MPPKVTFGLDIEKLLNSYNSTEQATIMTETATTTSSSMLVTTTTNTDITNSEHVDNNNRENFSPPVSSSATVALSYLKQPMVVREAAAVAAAEASKHNPNTPPLDLTKEDDFTKIDQSVSTLQSTRNPKKLSETI